MNICQPLIIGVTGHSEQQYIKETIFSGMNQVFTKPVKKEIVKEIVNMVGYPIESEWNYMLLWIYIIIYNNLF